MFIRSRKGQSAVEYIVLIIIVIGALITMSAYFKRGLQGRWRTAVDDMGEQYDPRTANTDLRHTLVIDTVSQIYTIEDTASGGFWTYRDDVTNSVETKTGFRRIGASP